MCYNVDALEQIGAGLGQDLNEFIHWAKDTYHFIFDDFNMLGLIDLVTIFESEF